MNPTITIEKVDTAHTGDWNAFLEQCPHANFYQKPEWQVVNARHFRHAVSNIVAYRDNAWVGVLPLVHIRSTLFGRILCSMPFVNFGGPASMDREVESALVAASCEEAEQTDCDYIELRCARPLATDLPCSTRKVSMAIELDPNPEVVWNAFKSKHRTQIRRAYKDGLSVEHGGSEYLDYFYDLMGVSWRALGTPLYRKAYFRDILEAMPSNTRIFVAKINERPVAAAFNGYFRDTVEGMWATVDPAAKRFNPNYVLYWEMINHACKQGFRYYHLGRSTAGSNAEQFKEKWNATATPLYWYYHLINRQEMPALNPDNPRYRIAIKIWRKLPLTFTGIVGPLLAKYIP